MESGQIYGGFFTYLTSFYKRTVEQSRKPSWRNFNKVDDSVTVMKDDVRHQRYHYKVTESVLSWTDQFLDSTKDISSENE